MKLMLVLLAATLTGCGTINTVFRDDQVTVKNLNDAKSYCGAVPRVYSGVMYDFCALHAPVKESDSRTGSSSYAMGMVLDVAISGALDTLVLPYTLVRQHTDGSMVLN